MSWVSIAACSGFFAVALGAFGAHGLKAILDAQSFAVFELANRYHFIHTLALLGFGLWVTGTRRSNLPGLLIGFGMLIFSGSLYFLAVTQVKWLGAITPIGGVFLLLGWGTWAYHAWGNG